MRNYLISLVVFMTIIVVFLVGVGTITERADKEGLATLEKALQRASVQCYAIEGRYPPSVEYIEENYGVQIDDKKYQVFYEGFASNLMPDITVMSKENVQ